MTTVALILVDLLAGRRQVYCCYMASRRTGCSDSRTSTLRCPISRHRNVGGQRTRVKCAPPSFYFLYFHSNDSAVYYWHFLSSILVLYFVSKYLLLLLSLTYMTDKASVWVEEFKLYSGGARFEFWPVSSLSRLRTSLVLLSPSMQMPV